MLLNEKCCCGRSGNNRGAAQRAVDHRDGWKGNDAVGAEHSWYQRQHRRGYTDQGTRSNVFLMVAFVQSEIMFGRRLERCGSDSMLMASRKMDEGGIFEKILCVDLSFKIEKRLYRKEYAVHRQDEGVEQNLMYSFFHVSAGCKNSDKTRVGGSKPAFLQEKPHDPVYNGCQQRTDGYGQDPCPDQVDRHSPTD